MKTIFTTLFALAASIALLGQTDDYPMPDSATVVDFPWYDHNQYLLDYIAQRGY